jgi:hypothetical protein
VVAALPAARVAVAAASIQTCLLWRYEAASEAGKLAPCASPRARAARGGTSAHHGEGGHGSPVRPEGADPSPARWLAEWRRQAAKREPPQEPWSATATTAGLSGRSTVRPVPNHPSSPGERPGAPNRARNGHETMKSPRDYHWVVLEKYRASCAFSLGAGDGNRGRGSRSGTASALC